MSAPTPASTAPDDKWLRVEEMKRFGKIHKGRVLNSSLEKNKKVKCQYH